MQQLLRLVYAGGDGLFNKHVHAVFHRGLCDLIVHACGNDDTHRVGAGLFEEHFKIVVCAYTKRFRYRMRALVVYIDHADKLSPQYLRIYSRVVHPQMPDADNSNPY
ncbi:hypothetical protein SDC9_93522 [bioreactor metagenome]|uniref:Uncharacterized protein n=1 Tax=bioreactor metagenome TaxID=1076179 RepID=A0A645A0U7_9ZZZZ